MKDITDKLHVQEIGCAREYYEDKNHRVFDLKTKVLIWIILKEIDDDLFDEKYCQVSKYTSRKSRLTTKKLLAFPKCSNSKANLRRHSGHSEVYFK